MLLKCWQRDLVTRAGHGTATEDAIDCTFTAVPQEYGISLSRRYTLALGLSQERNTALIAPISCLVAGVRTPMHISEMEQKFPEAFVQFKQVCETLVYLGYGDQS